MHGELCTDCYVFNLEHTTKPLVTFSSPDHVTVMDYNDKNPQLIGGGCYRGQVCWWDERTGGLAAGQSEFEQGHSDVVYTFKWIGKTGHEFFTGSSDGYIKWWDIRNDVDQFLESLLNTFYHTITRKELKRNFYSTKI